MGIEQDDPKIHPEIVVKEESISSTTDEAS